MKQRFEGENEERREALYLLTSATIKLRAARKEQLRLMVKARAAGLSNAAIGRVLGVTEAAVRSMLARHMKEVGPNVVQG